MYPYKVKIIQGAIDSRYLWAGVIGTSLMTILCFSNLGTTGKLVIKKTINDSDVGDRAILGGPNQLVKATIKVLADETCPPNLFILGLNMVTLPQICSFVERENHKKR